MAQMCTVSRLERQFAKSYLFHAPTPLPPTPAWAAHSRSVAKRAKNGGKGEWEGGEGRAVARRKCDPYLEALDWISSWGYSRGHTQCTFIGAFVNAGDLRRNSGECEGGSGECCVSIANLRQTSSNFTKRDGDGGWGGVGTGKGTAKWICKLCRNYPLATYRLKSARERTQFHTPSHLIRGPTLARIRKRASLEIFCLFSCA